MAAFQCSLPADAGRKSVQKSKYQCPAQEIKGGRYPYLYGGRPDGCRQCQSEEYVSKFCQFGMDGHGQCWGGRREQLIHYYLERGFTDILTFTPCDMWPLLRGRTLFFSGDSQTQVLSIAVWLPVLSISACFGISLGCELRYAQQSASRNEAQPPVEVLVKGAEQTMWQDCFFCMSPTHCHHTLEKEGVSIRPLLECEDASIHAASSEVSTDDDSHRIQPARSILHER